MLQSQFAGQGQNFFTVTNQNDFGQPVGQGTVGGGQSALLQALGQYDALLVALGARDDFLN